MVENAAIVEPIEEPQIPDPPITPAPGEPETVAPEPMDIAPEPTPTGEPGGPIDAAPKPDDKLLAEIDKLNKRVGYMQRQLERQPPAQEPTPEPEIVSSKPKPSQESFETYDEYVEAIADWKVEARLKEMEREKATQTKSRGVEEFRDKLKRDGETAHEDFEEVVSNPTLPFNAVMMEILQGCENPHEVAYYLAKNQKEAATISRQTPIQAARAMGRIEMEVKASLTPAATPTPIRPAKTVTDAPTPINPIGPGEVITKDPKKMSQAEYEEARREGKL